MVTADKELDTKGLNCPLPILKTKKELASMSAGQTIHVIATDPGSVGDFEAFCQQTGHLLIESTVVDDSFHFHIEKR
ncbi:MAG: sulfurtransferase TusA family protein [Pseudomonadota bacterium]